MAVRISRSQRLIAVIGISCCFFLAEIAGMHLVLLFPTGEWDCFGFSYPGWDWSPGLQFPRQYESSLLVGRWLVCLVGFYTHSLALVADAFHYVCFRLSSWRTDAWGCWHLWQLNDLVGFIVALAAVKVDIAIPTEKIYRLYWQYQVSEQENPPKSLTFGWQRSQLLGAFFNGALLFALGISILLQSIERFVSLQR